MKLTKQSGFTLTEIIIVIVILSVLTGFGIPRYMDTVQKAKQKDAASILRLIKGAQALRYTKTEKFYPISGTVNIDNINQTLNLSVLQPSDVVYECEAKDAGNDFLCKAYYPDKSSPKWTRTLSYEDQGTCTAGAGGKCYDIETNY